jgi:hypothetical protein
MDYNAILSQVETYVRDFFRARADKKHVYHNLAHTESVVRGAVEIANHFQLEERRYFIVVSAAWFHDLGYFVDKANHEAEGARLARSFLEKAGVEATVIDKIEGCILATRLPQRPHGLLEEIVCDADLYHLGTESFRDTNKLMHREAELLSGKTISGTEWRVSTIAFLESHHYWTDYCQLALNDTQEVNLGRLKARQREKERELARKARRSQEREKEKAPKKETAGGGTSVAAAARAPKAASPADKTTKLVRKRPDRGIETMFRLTSSNNQRLSDMADNKAHILVTVNSIILSAVISLLMRKLDSNPHLTIPTYLILTVSVMTIIFSILATRPSITKGTFTMEDIRNKRVNLLFFGNFYKMSLEDYSQGMLSMMDDRDYLYGSLIKDIYGQGTVVARKYRLLRIAYNIFMYGLIVSVVAFILATYY